MWLNYVDLHLRKDRCLATTLAIFSISKVRLFLAWEVPIAYTVLTLAAECGCNLGITGFGFFLIVKAIAMRRGLLHDGQSKPMVTSSTPCSQGR